MGKLFGNNIICFPILIFSGLQKYFKLVWDKNSLVKLMTQPKMSPLCGHISKNSSESLHHRVTTSVGKITHIADQVDASSS